MSCALTPLYRSCSPLTFPVKHRGFDWRSDGIDNQPKPETNVSVQPFKRPRVGHSSGDSTSPLDYRPFGWPDDRESENGLIGVDVGGGGDPEGLVRIRN